MADRHQDRRFSPDDYDHRDDAQASARAEGDPLAELARLIGQSDQFGGMGRANARVQQRSNAHDQYPPAPEPDDLPPAGPPPWMQRANRQAIAQQQDYPETVHPLQRYAAARPAPDYHQEPTYADAEQDADPSRYDEALYGQLDPGDEQSQHDAGYADDAYAYQDDYQDGIEDQPYKRRGGVVTVAAVLALAVVGTGAAFAYRTYIGPVRSGEPPIIRADAGPTKIMPAPADGSAKVPDRMMPGDGAEKIVPREEAPVDVNSRAGQSGPRVVFPPLNQNGNPPSVASVVPGGPPLPSASNGTLPNTEPRKIKTFSVHGDQADAAAGPVGAAPPSPSAKPVLAPKAAASANAPLSLVPQGNQPAPAADSRTRIANTAPFQAAPVQTAPSGGGSSGGYVVQVSSQRNEADAQASYRVLQGKFPTVLGSRSPLIKRADLGDKGVYYRAMVGPFGSSDEASQFCGSLKTAGGQCVVQRN